MVKSVVSVMICGFVILSLCGCTNEKEFILGSFCSNVSFNVDDVSVSGKLDFKDKDNITFTIIEPENLSGIIFTESQIIKDDVTVNYAKLKDDSPVCILLSIIKNLAGSQIYLPYEGQYTLTGAVSLAEYKTVFDCEKEKIIRIETEKFTYIFE